MIKGYGCVFTCLSLRAIHIELLSDMTTDPFINAMQRFIARRGQPKQIQSDNGTNLTGGNRELKHAIQKRNQQKIDEFLKQKEIEWVFNPPAASHMGGVWERQIRTIRKLLNGLTREQTLDDEGHSTLMCMVEAIVNSRPLTTISDNPSDLEPLTPNP